jgi:cobalamin biosynthesis protein CobD
VGFVVETVLLFYCLSARSLGQAAMEIHTLLAAGEVDRARSQVAMIVGRDVERYQADDIARATVETVAENVVDGVLSPLFFAALGGAPLAMAYKMVNTLDSMVGYKNPRYLLFGRAAARIDDAANFLPARLAVPLIALAARLTAGLAARRALQHGLARRLAPCQPQRRLSGGSLCRRPRGAAQRPQLLPRRPGRQTLHRQGRWTGRRPSHQTGLPSDDRNLRSIDGGDW